MLTYVSNVSIYYKIEILVDIIRIKLIYIFIYFYNNFYLRYLRNI
jgi:hypothetical protein